MTEQPCPDCGHGMEAQAVCERCGKREPTPHAALREVFEAGWRAAGDMPTPAEIEGSFTKWLSRKHARKESRP